MRAFAVSGYSGSGKTTIIERIVKALCERGHSVITVKSSRHEIKKEEGTDTWKHQQAGAKATIMVGPDGSTVYYRNRRPLRDLIRPDDADYLIIEGMKSSDIPKFWCVGDTRFEIENIPSSAKAIVFWGERTQSTDSEIPLVQSDDIDRLLTIIEQYAIDISELNWQI